MSQPIEVHTLSGAFALDALTEIERAGFARHLAECEACATEVAEFRETAARLSAAAVEAPPAQLRDRVLAEVARTRQVTAGRTERASGGDAAMWRRRTLAAVAAGVVALGGMATVWVVQQQRVDQAQAEASQIAAVYAAGDAQVHTVDLGGGRITVIVSPSAHDAVAMMSGLPTPPAGKVYQLWLIKGTTPTSAGVMNAGQTTGRAVLAIGDADTLGVTVEPEGGSPAPTSSVARVPLA